MKTLTFISDPAHGWLAVPKDELKALGITDKITPYSYQHGDIAYLEEDCDAGVYLDALKANGTPFELREVFQENTPIRNYRPYCA